MSKTKAVTLTAMLALMGLGVACSSSSGIGEKANAPANNAPANVNKPTPPTPPATMIAGMTADTEAIYTAKCSFCHGQDAKGKGNAPDLFAVKDKHTAEEWASYLKNPKIWEKDNKMPPVKLSDDESKKISEWLAATTGKGAAAGPEKKEEKKDEKSEGTKKS